MPPIRSFTLTPSRLKDILLLFSLLAVVYLTFRNPLPRPPPSDRGELPSSSTPTTRSHILFSIASSYGVFLRRKPYISLWYDPNSTRAFAFLDAAPADLPSDLPPVIISEDTSRFPYTFKGGLRSAIRVARVVKEAVELNQTGVRWFVFGDDDTVFFVDNLIKTLSKYDHTRWFYIGSNSESYEQNMKHSFDMGFGGGGFAISSPLARVLSRVLDSCLVRYSHLYGSDARIFSCLAELGVGLTHEPGFHQVDLRGNLFGLLSAHPLSPLISLHHLEASTPVFPTMNQTQAMEHLFQAVHADPTRILQQVVCYDHTNSFTVSIAWGYSIQVFEGNELLPDLLSLQQTFSPWRRHRNPLAGYYMFTMRPYPKDPCKRPAVFFMKNVKSGEDGIWSSYTRHNVEDCSRASRAINNLEYIKVSSDKLKLDAEQIWALRRQCCDVSSSSEKSMERENCKNSVARFHLTAEEFESGLDGSKQTSANIC
ncbi:unnamed protein product [Linum trigynum]|uniref:Uncharacterized protein n=1 Tax=Linum trigynum TaxID=586398 RepID=A0AAV2F868_9ROSI